MEENKYTIMGGNREAQNLMDQIFNNPEKISFKKNNVDLEVYQIDSANEIGFEMIWKDDTAWVYLSKSETEKLIQFLQKQIL